VAWKELEADAVGPTSREVRDRVAEARRCQEKRGGAHARTNAELPDDVLDELVAATPEARALLGRAVDRLALSARAARRVLRVARTIADLAGDERTPVRAVAEARGYRDGLALGGRASSRMNRVGRGCRKGRTGTRSP
jgi:magnesium chelatase family protein